MPADKPVLFLQAIERTYRQGDNLLNILRRAELAVWAGQLVALIAPSGAGKSTLLHVAGLLERQDAGEVFVNSRPTSQLSDVDRTRIRRVEMGFIYQAHHLLPELSALENVMLPQMIRGLGKRDAAARAAELLSYLGLKERLTHRPAELSGGEQQRVALARALINKPAIVLADEPTGNLDSKNSEIVLAMLRHSNQELGQTVLMITHNPEAASYGDRIIHMRDGEIVAPEKDPQWTGHST
jgi:lipoprotein-releasing system ATP-binding protein